MQRKCLGERTFFEFPGEELKSVTFFDLKLALCLELKAALLAFKDLFRLLLLTLYLHDFDFSNSLFIADKACESTWGYFAAEHFTATDNFVASRTEDAEHLEFTGLGFDDLRREHVFHKNANVVEEFVNNLKDTDTHLVARRETLDCWWQLDVKAVDNST